MALPDLPPELVEHIARLLCDKDILNLRLTCQQLRRKSASAFAAAFFSTVAIDLCPDPLQRLRRIAQDDFLRLHVRQLIIGELPRGCSNPPRHPPGLGFRWARDPSSKCLDPSPSTNPVISHLHATLSRLVNLRSVIIKDDLAPEPEPRETTDTSLCLMDTIHVALLAVQHIPVKSFRVQHGSLMRGGVHSLLPHSVVHSLAPPWATDLVDLQLGGYTQHNPDRDGDSASLLACLVLRAKALRRLAIFGLTDEFYRRMPAAEGLPPSELLDLRGARNMTPEVMTAFVAKFRDTLEHLYLLQVNQGGWATVLRDWAVNLPRLKGFGLHYMTSDPNARPMLFDRVLEWEWEGEGVPEDGEMEIAVQSVDAGRQGITGVRYQGKTDDAQRVLAKMAEVGYTAPRTNVPLRCGSGLKMHI